MFDLNTQRARDKSSPASKASGSVVPCQGVKNIPLWQSLTVSPATIQTKLAVSQPGDAYEQEADRVANRVMQMPANPRRDEMSSIDRAPAHVQRMCAECAEEEEGNLQRKAESNDRPKDSPLRSRSEMFSGPGHQLDRETRDFFEPRFGRSFDQVRVHTDVDASAAANRVNALAFTLGRDIAFRAGAYAPHSPGGRMLLAHELTHVAQQADGREPTMIQRWTARNCNDAQSVYVDDAFATNP